MALAATLVVLAPAASTAGAASKAERAAMHRCGQANPKACVVRAALHRRQSVADMLRVSHCESTWNPYAFNGAHAGLFQFRTAYPSTWATTPYGRFSPYSAKWNALAAAWMWAVGRRGEWACR